MISGTSIRATRGWGFRVAFVLLLAAFGIGLATLGLNRGLPEAPWGDEAWRWNSLWTQALQLLLLPWLPASPDAAAPAPWARWMLPLALVALSFEQAARWLIPHWRRLRLAGASDHLIVVGDDEMPQALASAWALAGRRVALLGSAAQPRGPRDAGVIVVASKAGDAEPPWLRAGLAQAERVVLWSHDDSLNITQALQIANELAGRRDPLAPPLQMWVHVHDPFLRSQVETRLAAQAAAAPVETRLFSSAQMSARRLLRDSPARRHRTVNERGVAPAAWVLVGDTPLAEALLLQIIRADLSAEDESAHVLLVSADAAGQLQRLLARWPGLQEVARIETLALQPEQASLAAQSVADRFDATPVVCFCLESEMANIACAMVWVDTCAGAGQHVPPMVIRQLDGRPPLPESMLGAVNVQVCGTVDEVVAEIVSGGELDTLARGQHEAYLAHALGAGEMLGARRALQRWHALAEDLRDDNRQLADHQFCKLQVAGRVALPAGQGQPLVWRDDEIEALARLEHARWMRQRTLTGWRFDTLRDDVAKRHPAMAPYHALPAALQELDRETVRNLPRLLQTAGMSVARRHDVMLSGPHVPWLFAPAFEAAALALLDRLFEGCPAAARVLWVRGDSAMAWRVAELALARAGVRLGLVLDEPMAQRLERQPDPALRQRLATLAARAQLSWRGRAGAVAVPPPFDAELQFSVDGHELTASARRWGMDATGRLCLQPAEAAP